MNTKTLSSGITFREILIFLISSLAIVLFLFYIDEGYYSFNYMKEAFAWLIILIYLIPALLGQVFVFLLLKKIKVYLARIILSVIYGASLGIAMVITAFYLF